MMPSLALLILAYIGFVSLGLPDAVYGVAWPGLRRDFGLPQSGLGLLLACGGAGYFLSSFFTGRLLQLMHLGTLLFVSTAAVSLGLLGFATLTSWSLFLACAFVIGTGSGAIDGALNSYASRNFSPRHMSWLHGCYGIGASIGPAVMTRAVAEIGSWRTGYLELATILGMLTITFLVTRSIWGETKQSGAGQPHTAAASLREALSNKGVLLGALTFFIYTGLEGTLGQWNFTLNTEGRGAQEAWAGSLSVLFWASLTAGRFLMGILVARLGPQRALALSFAGALVGAGIFALPWLAASAVGLALAGFGMAPIYPLLMSETPRRVGTRMTDHAVGLQVSSATLGIIVMPGLAGVFAQYIGLAAIRPLAIALAVALVALHLVTATVQKSAAFADEDKSQHI